MYYDFFKDKSINFVLENSDSFSNYWLMTKLYLKI